MEFFIQHLDTDLCGFCLYLFEGGIEHCCGTEVGNLSDLVFIKAADEGSDLGIDGKCIVGVTQEKDIDLFIHWNRDGKCFYSQLCCYCLCEALCVS